MNFTLSLIAALSCAFAAGWVLRNITLRQRVVRLHQLEKQQQMQTTLRTALLNTYAGTLLAATMCDISEASRRAIADMRTVEAMELIAQEADQSAESGQPAADTITPLHKETFND